MLNPVLKFTGEVQTEEMEKEMQAQQPKQKKTRSCKKCRQPMKGHPHSYCPDAAIPSPGDN